MNNKNIELSIENRVIDNIYKACGQDGVKATAFIIWILQKSTIGDLVDFEKATERK